MQCQRDLQLIVLFVACLGIFLWDPNPVSLAVTGVLFPVGFALYQYKHNPHPRSASGKREPH